MKILQLGKFYPIQGGVEKVMFDLTNGLTKLCLDMDCDMMCVEATPQPFKTKLNSHSVLYCCKLNKKLFSTMLSVDLIFKLKRICGEYDIIHIHHPDPMAALALRISGFRGKVVLHWHSDILKQKNLLKLFMPLQNWLINRADLILGTSPKYLDESPHLRNCKKEKIPVPIGIESVIPNPEKVEAIKERYKSRRIIFSLGRLVGYKGYEYLIDAAKYLSDEYIILIGGSGPLKDVLEQQIKMENLGDKVKLLGRVSDDDLPNYYGASTVYVMSSIWKTEAFGIVQIEAMSCGKPIIATHIPESGVDWVNKDGFSGLNVPPGDSKAIAEAIDKICSNKQSYETFSKNSKQRFDEMFTLSKMIERVCSIYSELLSR